MHLSSRLLPAAAIVLVASACGGDAASDSDADASPASAEFPLTIENCGREITIEQRPERVLSIGSSAVNLLHAAGAADRIAARAAEFGTPIPGAAGEAVADVPIIDPEDPTAEVIIGADVDIVIGYGLWETTPEDLEAAGIPTLVSSASCGQNVASWGEFEGVSFDNIYADLELYGALFDADGQAATAVAELQDRVAAVEADTANLPFGSAAAVWFSGDSPGVLGDRHMMHGMITTLGLANAFEDLGEQYAEPSIEEFIDRDPEVVIVVYGYFGEETFDEAKAKLLALPGVDDMDAVVNDRIVGLFYAEVEPQPSAVDGLEELADALTSFVS